MKSIKSIARELESICFTIEKEIVGNGEKDARLWAASNAVRHARIIVDILDYCRKNSRKKLKILNASGLSSGHQDVSIVSYLKEIENLEVCWISCESPNSHYLQNPLLQRYVSSLKIDLHLIDFRNDQRLFGNHLNFDIVVFTEIAEHLEHSILLKTLVAIRGALKPKGQILITTPNLLSFWNRKQFLKGNGDFPYWGDGLANMKTGLYGHIVNYDISRLRRILMDVGFRILMAKTFTFVQRRYEQTLKHLLSGMLMDWLCERGALLGTNIHIKAEPSREQVRIPLRL